MKQEPGKRIVSKGAYAKAQGKRAALEIVSFFLACVMAVCGMLTGIALIWFIVSVAHSYGDRTIIGFMAMVGICGLCTALSYHGQKITSKTAQNIDPGVPLTRANTADLPAPDSLVRASSEPVQAQATVLLRAAAGGQEQHEEQLLRAAGGQEQQW